MTRPKLVLAMRADRTPDLIGPGQWRRLGEVATILDATPLESFAEPRAGGLLAEAEVLLIGWGCPPIETDVLARAPRLALVAHTGSTVKPFVSDALWARGVRVTSAAAANAVPVAEFTLAAILFANKGVFRVRELYRAAPQADAYPFIAPGEPGNLRARSASSAPRASAAGSSSGCARSISTSASTIRLPIPRSCAASA